MVFHGLHGPSGHTAWHFPDFHACDGGADMIDNLRNCIDKLDGRAKLAVQMSYGIGDEEAADPAVADRADVASKLELTPNGLKTLLQRSRQLLRSCLERAKK